MRDRKPRNMRRYHMDVWFPENAKLGRMVLDFFTQFDAVNVTYHSAEQLLEDPRGVIPLPTKAQLLDPQNQLVEFYELIDDETKQPTGIIQKCLVRVRGLSEKFDYCYVVAREGFVVSAWANDKDDNHRLTSTYNTYYDPSTNETLEIPMPNVLKDNASA